MEVELPALKPVKKRNGAFDVLIIFGILLSLVIFVYCFVLIEKEMVTEQNMRSVSIQVRKLSRVRKFIQKKLKSKMD